VVTVFYIVLIESQSTISVLGSQDYARSQNCILIDSNNRNSGLDIKHHFILGFPRLLIGIKIYNQV